MSSINNTSRALHIEAPIAHDVSAGSAGPAADLPGTLIRLAKNAESRGGMLAEHIVGLQKFATERKLCIAIRAVNPSAAALIRSGFATKDMEIKGKSSRIPPLNGLVPRNQKYARDSLPTEQAQLLSAANEAAIQDRKATAVSLNLPASFIRNAINLTIVGNWLQTGQNGSAGAMIANVKEKKFLFWGEIQEDSTVNVYECNKNGEIYEKSQRIEVIGNRKGLAVTSDYDLVFAAPRIESLSNHHMRPLNLGGDFRSDSIASGEVRKLVPISLAALIEMRRRSPLLEPFRKLPILDALKLEVAAAQIKSETRYEVEPVLDKGLEPPKRGLGNISHFLKELLPQLNKACGVERGHEVFHHGDDAGNPNSVEKDNYPITLILPDKSDIPSDMPRIVMIESRFDLSKAIKFIKDAHFVPDVSYSWGAEVIGVRSRFYEDAKAKLQLSFPKRRNSEPTLQIATTQDE